MTFGYSRDDIASFLPVYLEKKILKVDPFQVLDQDGVGQLIKMAVEKGRSTRKNLMCGICGEHGGEPSSVKFCHRVGPVSYTHLFSKKFYYVEEGCWISLKISAAGLRLINKVGLDAALKQAVSKGYCDWKDIKVIGE